MKTLIVFQVSLILSSFFSASGKLIIVGGDLASDNVDVYKAFIGQATPSSGSPYIGVITAGNSYNSAKSTANGIISRLQRTYKVDNVEWLPFHKDNGRSCASSSLNSKIRSMTGLYFNGGETSYVLDCFLPSGRASSALSFIKDQYESNRLAIFASSAAALALQSTPVLGARTSWRSLYSGTDVESDEGFGIFPFGFIDVHFSNRGRMGRLIRLAIDFQNEASVGYGLDQDTAMVVQGNSFKVIGSGGVYVVSTRQAEEYSGKRFDVEDIQVSLLTDGDWCDLRTGEIDFASWKKALTSTNQVRMAVKSVNNIFDDQAFETLSTRLVQSRISDTTYGLTAENRPRFRIDLRKTEDTVAVVGQSGGKSLVSYEKLFVDVYCYQNC